MLYKGREREKKEYFCFLLRAIDNIIVTPHTKITPSIYINILFSI